MPEWMATTRAAGSSERITPRCMHSWLYERITPRCMHSWLYERITPRCMHSWLYERITPRCMQSWLYERITPRCMQSLLSYLMFPIWSREASIFIMSLISLSENMRTFMADRMPMNSARSSRPSQVISPPWNIPRTSDRLHESSQWRECYLMSSKGKDTETRKPARTPELSNQQKTSSTKWPWPVPAKLSQTTDNLITP